MERLQLLDWVSVCIVAARVQCSYTGIMVFHNKLSWFVSELVLDFLVISKRFGQSLGTGSMETVLLSTQVQMKLVML